MGRFIDQHRCPRSPVLYSVPNCIHERNIAVKSTGRMKQLRVENKYLSQVGLIKSHS